MNKLILSTDELNLVEPSKAQKIKDTFEPMVLMLESFEQTYKAIIEESKKGITPDLIAKAKRTRLDIAQIRIKTANLKDSEKEEYKRAANAIQGVHNIIVWAVVDYENQLKFIEETPKRLETERLEKLQLERAEQLQKYIEDAHERNLANMEEDVWLAYFGAKKQAYEDYQAAEAAARLAQIQKEKEAKEEQERIIKENKKLLLEREEANKKAENERILREKANREREFRDQKERKRLAEIEAIKQAEIRAELDAERKQREAIQEKIKAKEDAERLEREKAEAIEQANLAKGDSSKLKDLLNDLEILKTKYSFTSAKNVKIYSDVTILIEKIQKHIKG